MFCGALERSRHHDTGTVDWLVSCGISYPMGTGHDILDILGRLRRDGHFSSPDRSVAEIGAQQLANNFLRATDQISEIGALFGVDRPFNLPPPLPSSTVNSFELLNPEAPLSRMFWLWLGFDYVSIDVDGSPDAVPLDLNVDTVPDHMCNRFDLVTNLGTTEHVANQWNAFRIAHDLTKPGGIMLHNVPCQGFLTHGLVDYTPKFFWYLERSNHYTRLDIELLPSADSYAVPPDVLTGLRVCGEEAASYRVRDVGIRVLLRKNTDAEFVPPIDVPTGSRTKFPDLLHRYRQIFDPDGETRTRMEFRVAELGAALKQTRTELEAARAQFEEVHAQLAASRGALSESRKQIEAARASVSWRITAPLRGLARMLSTRP